MFHACTSSQPSTAALHSAHAPSAAAAARVLGLPGSRRGAARGMRRASRNRLLCAPPTDRPCSFVIFVFNLTLNGVVLGQYTGHGDKPGSAAYMVRFPGYHHMLLAQRAPSGWRQASLPGFSPWDCPWGGYALKVGLPTRFLCALRAVGQGRLDQPGQHMGGEPQLCGMCSAGGSCCT